MRANKDLLDTLKLYEDKKLQEQFTEDELRYIKIACASLLSVRKETEPITVFVNKNTYKYVLLFYLRLGGEINTISSKSAIFKEIDKLQKEKEHNKLWQETVKQSELRQTTQQD